MTTQASLDVWSSRLYELKLEELTRENAALRASLLDAMTLIDGWGVGDFGRYDEWWNRCNELLRIGQ